MKAEEQWKIDVLKKAGCEAEHTKEKTWKGSGDKKKKTNSKQTKAIQGCNIERANGQSAATKQSEPNEAKCTSNNINEIHSAKFQSATNNADQPTKKAKITQTPFQDTGTNHIANAED